MPLAKQLSKSRPSDILGEYLRRTRTARYFSNVFTRQGLALMHLPTCPLRRDNQWTKIKIKPRRNQNICGSILMLCHVPFAA